MSRRVPTTGIQRAGSRAPSISLTRPAKPSSSRQSAAEPPSPAVRRRRLSAAAGSVRVPTQAEETNINVVVRCRGKSDQEVADASPLVVKTDGALGKAVTIETTPSAAASSSSAAFTTASAYAGAGQPNTKTYPFDKVFGPAADQTMIFSEVAEGMLDEVLNGFNCTIFAYGQTGTGKTYTMQGDTTPTPLMEPSIHAGIIPRVLHRLFAKLEAQEGAEYAVKCSYIELYNEELRDLLAPEYKDSVGSVIKIFDDSAKKGVHVQGVEEAGLCNLKDGLAALAKGTNRRQTAETKMNSESSRSHSIFTLTVHYREGGVDKGAEDLLRIGKFNLVDLAGSEAIGRSGAENKRAREAGMINQSLLTLGRVISALVDKSTHIPYRESKLTRLLQDSLGGRTKTCIIATVSPTRPNMEETISTLDYALRAKSIKNKPEVNAHLTKAGLLKEYLQEIERLKAELFATREKNGVYIPEDMFKDMQQNQNRTKSEFDEARQRVATIEVELKTLKTHFDSLTKTFIITRDELETSRQSEEQLTALLQAAKVDVDRAEAALTEEKVVSGAYAAGEARLDKVATELHGVAVESVRDVGGLFDKLGRLSTVLDTNTDSGSEFGSKMQELSQDLQRGIAQIHTVQGQLGRTLQANLEAYARTGKKESQTYRSELDASLGAFDRLAQNLSQSVTDGEGENGNTADAIMAIKNEVQASVRSWSQEVSERSTQMVGDLLQHQGQHLSVVGGVLESTAELLDAVISAARDNIQSQAEAFAQAKQKATSAADAELGRLRTQNELLSRLLAEERARTSTLRTDLITGISDMIVGFTEKQDASLSAAVSKVQAGNERGLEEIGQFASEHAAVVDDAMQSASAFSHVLEARSADVEKQRGKGAEALSEVTSGMRGRLGDYAQQTVTEAEEHVQTVDAFCERLGGTSSKLSADSASRAKSQSRTIASLYENVHDTNDRAKKRVKTNALEVERLTSTLLDSHATSSETSAQAHDAAQQSLGKIQKATARFLDGMAYDQPTGATPKKRSWDMPHAWERTEPRQILLDTHRRRLGPVDAPRLSVGSASTVSDSTIASVETSDLPHVSSAASLQSLKSSTSSLDERPSLPGRTLSASHLGVTLRSPTKRMMPRKQLSRENSMEDRPSLSVLGEGGNVPRRRRL